jgi:hypothetical protein
LIVARYKMAPGVALLIVKDRQGKLWHHYAAGASGVARGPLIDWLGDDQRENWLRLGLVEEIDDAPAAQPHRAHSDPVPDVNAEILDGCIRDLDRLGLPAEAGAPSARKALRDAGLSYGNDIIAAAVRERKTLAAQPSGT